MLHRIKEENEFKKVTDAMSVLFKGHVDRGHTVWLETRAGFLAVVCEKCNPRVQAYGPSTKIFTYHKGR